MKILPVGAELFHADRHKNVTKLVVIFFLQFCESTKKWVLTNEVRGFGPDSSNSKWGTVRGLFNSVMKMRFHNRDETAWLAVSTRFRKTDHRALNWVTCGL